MKLDATLVIGAAAIAALMLLLIMLPPGADLKEKNWSLGANAADGAEVPKSYMLGIMADRGSYEGNSKANFKINLTSPYNLTGELRVWGVKNRYGAYRIDEKQEVKLVEGVNIINKTETLPACTRCAGIDPGNFSVYCALYVNGTEIINSSTQIQITQ